MEAAARWYRRHEENRDGEKAENEARASRLGLQQGRGTGELAVTGIKARVRYAIDEFIQWYCSEPRPSFNKVVVTRFRIALENRGLAAGTINGRLAAVRRPAYEATDAGLLSPELAAGIRRVKGIKKLGVWCPAS